ncbi:hypothetical protein GGX14DRAFT_415824 [Mycena pura]|uniref:Uncharacterized protein n=1 Tax=Mycena pura TaxID=153505 RepID=A0AAD7E5N9_9AGAR|nr:hypothetical protein GGX14DRAFT_415824 [Mycena pura]
MLTVLRIPDAGTSTARPRLARQETDLLASYYQSPLADQGIGYTPKTRPGHHRTLSGHSTSSSDYSSGGSTSDHSEHVSPPRRSSVPSEGGADRRRLAIVQMDPLPEADLQKSSAVRSRRGLKTRLDGIALVAPPDAAPKSYAYLDPPSSAPPNPNPAHSMSRQLEAKSHHRSASEATTNSAKSKRSRDVGIVGTTSSLHPDSPKKLRLELASDSLHPPVFQEPHSSRASSPNDISTPSVPSSPSLSLPQVKRRSTDLSIHTPEIGQPKDIHVPVASPVVVDLGLDPSLRARKSTRRSSAIQVVEPRSASPLSFSAYLHYQPGIHATAGPLPPPPRATFAIDPSTPPPPRPPRLHSPPPRRKDDQALQLPGVAAVLNSSGSSTPSVSSRSISPIQPIDVGSSEDSNDETLHRREGAFSPSTISTTPSTSPSDYTPTPRPVGTIGGLIPDVDEGGKSIGVPSVVIATPRLESLREQSGDDWTHVSRDLTTSPSSEEHMSHSWDSHPPPAPSQDGATPSPPPKSFKTSLTTGLKRFSSLPRTPSPSSKSLARSSSTRSQLPSPSAQVVSLPAPTPQMPRRRKIISQYPAALFCGDMRSRKSATERCTLYAQKLNELYVHDSGLSEWLLEVQIRGANGQGKRSVKGTSRSGPQQRHVSGTSMKSEATFPRRPDAMIATDLATKPSDIAPIVPTLPYPALSPRSLAAPLSPRSLAAPLSPTSLRTLGSPPSSKTGNFFSSLGRKASMSKKDRPIVSSFSLSSSATTTRLVKSPPSARDRDAHPRTAAVASVPSVPGGPRAPPNRARALRTQSISPVPSPSPFASNATAASRRPSLFAPLSSMSSSESHSQSRSTASASDHGPGFEHQVDKLSDLLPHAERAVLAGYLRRAGQDILAIGQYLEDEKHGTLRRD